VAGGWRRLHNEELHNFCSTPNTIRVISSKTKTWVGHVECIGELRNADKTFVGELEGNRLFGRSRRRWEDNIRMGLREIGWRSVNWIHLAQDKDQWRVL
jgi:hypothetical protein